MTDPTFFLSQQDNAKTELDHCLLTDGCTSNPIRKTRGRMARDSAFIK